MPNKNTADIIFKAQSLYKKGEFREVIKYLEKKLPQIKEPNDLCLAHLTMARGFHSLNESGLAVVACRKAVKYNPSFDKAWYELGLNLWRLKCFNEALEAYQTAVHIYPSDYRYHLNLALVLREVNRSREAIPHYDALLAMEPSSARYLRNKTSCITYSSTDNSDFHLLSQITKNPLSHADSKMYAFYGLIKIYHDCGMFHEASESALAANQMRKKIFPFNPQVLADALSQIKEQFRELKFDDYLGHASDKPVFIVGLSRSGKTLLESLLAQQLFVHAKHECCFVGTMKHDYRKRLKLNHFYPDGLSKLLSGGLKSFAQKYYGMLCYGVDPDAQLITDTTPQNIEHIGLLKLMFPNAKFILCERDPLDNYVKIFLKYYVRGNGYANDMKHIQFYHQQMTRLATFWEKECGIDILRVRYETLLDSPAVVMDEVSRFCQIQTEPFDFSSLNRSDIGIANHYPELTSSITPAQAFSKVRRPGS